MRVISLESLSLTFYLSLSLSRLFYEHSIIFFMLNRNKLFMLSIVGQETKICFLYNLSKVLINYFIQFLKTD